MSSEISLNHAVQKVITSLVTGSRRVEMPCSYGKYSAIVKGYWVRGLMRIDILGKAVEDDRPN